jgi:hypothetical protein
MYGFSFASDGLKLDGSIFQPTTNEAKYPAVLFIHGWTSERIRSYQYAQALTDIGYVCVLVDLRGHGSSQGDRNTTSSKEFLRDVVAAYDFEATLPYVDEENISVVGSSFGCYLIALLTKERKVKNLVLRAPADYPNELFDVARGSREVTKFDILEWRAKKRASDETYALAALHDFDGETLIIESELDETIPHQVIENYMSAIKKINHPAPRGGV